MARPYTNGERLRMCEELMRRGASCSVQTLHDPATGRELQEFQLELGDLRCRSRDFFECIDMLLDSLFEAWGTEHAAAAASADGRTSAGAGSRHAGNGRLIQLRE